MAHTIKNAYDLVENDVIVNVGTVDLAIKFKNGIRVYLKHSHLIKVHTVFYPYNKQLVVNN